MALVMVDLDNTLVDRAGAVRRWAARFSTQHGGSCADAQWIEAADRDGLEPRESFAQAVIARVNSPLSVEVVVAGLREHLIERQDLLPGVSDAIARLRGQGHRVACVTNGTTTGQRATLEAVGLSHAFDAVLISEEVGVKKPDRRIFELAAQLTHESLEGAWMVGDSPTSDIAGAAAVGCHTVWLARGRTWPVELVLPTAIANDPSSALALIPRP